MNPLCPIAVINFFNEGIYRWKKHTFRDPKRADYESCNNDIKVYLQAAPRSILLMQDVKLALVAAAHLPDLSPKFSG
jgi:hypothetical protein